MTTQRLQTTLAKDRLLSIYFTADFPHPHTTLPILRSLQASGVDIVELGIPFSDPLADGPTIQHAHHVALTHGFSFERLFAELKEMRQTIHIPIVAMTYLNPILQYGIERFLQQLQHVGIDGVIAPDLPIAIYKETYQPLFAKYGVSFIPIVLPDTDAARIAEIYAVADSFVYLLSSSTTTGNALEKNEAIPHFFSTHRSAITLPTLIGFGIRNQEDFAYVCQYGKGGIIGSSFINAIKDATVDELPDKCAHFIQQIKPSAK